MQEQKAAVTELYVHPIKGCRPIAVDEIEVNEFGVSGDREYMLVQDQQRVNLKEIPALATVKVTRSADDELRLSAEGFEDYRHTKMSQGESSVASFLMDKVQTIDQGDAVARWFSAVVGHDVRLVSLQDSFTRNLPVEPLIAAHGVQQNSFVDVSPLMIVNEMTLKDLNSKLQHAVVVQRFRPNIVIGGLAAYQEDATLKLSNDQFELSHVSPCERCVIVNTDHETGLREHKDPLKMLSQYRKIENGYDSGIVFGNYFNVSGRGVIRVGDEFLVH